MADERHPGDLATVRLERDLYLRLLRLGRETEPEPFLKEALQLIVEVTEARQGYLEIQAGDVDGTDDGTEPWWMAHGFSAEELEGVRSAISSGIIASAVASGQTVMTSSALLDPRFSGRESVRSGRIQEVLCVPIAQDPPLGVLYLQGRVTSRAYSPDDRARAETFAEHLAPQVDRLLARRRQAADPTRALRSGLRADGVVGRSAALATVLHQVKLVAPLDISVLLTGDSGTGKSQLARVIHDSGPRAGQAFVEVNCATLPENLVESELFGALPGAHSTATRRIDGKVAAAERGTLFLDEIGELCPAAQAKLLQLLHSKEYYPLGGTRSVLADVRLITATNTDLQRAVQEHRFREDLFYRLHVLPVRVPTLAERREDIPELAAFFCASATDRHGLPRLEISRAAIRALESAEWPGNVRQLANAVEAAAIRAAAEGARQLESAHLFPAGGAGREEVVGALTFQESTRRHQAELLRQTLHDSGWNVVETARRLDLTRSHVYNLIRAFGLQRQS